MNLTIHLKSGVEIRVERVIEWKLDPQLMTLTWSQWRDAPVLLDFVDYDSIAAVTWEDTHD